MTDTLYATDHTGVIDEPYREDAGFIAQDVLKIPELAFAVTGGDYVDTEGKTIEHSYQLNYDAVFTYAVSAIQELSAQVKVLQARLDAACL